MLIVAGVLLLAIAAALAFAHAVRALRERCWARPGVLQQGPVEVRVAGFYKQRVVIERALQQALDFWNGVAGVYPVAPTGQGPRLGAQPLFLDVGEVPRQSQSVILVTKAEARLVGGARMAWSRPKRGGRSVHEILVDETAVGLFLAEGGDWLKLSRELAHCLGHVLGLGHESESESVMCSWLPFGLGVSKVMSAEVREIAMKVGGHAAE